MKGLSKYLLIATLFTCSCAENMVKVEEPEEEEPEMIELLPISEDLEWSFEFADYSQGNFQSWRKSGLVNFRWKSSETDGSVKMHELGGEFEGTEIFCCNEDLSTTSREVSFEESMFIREYRDSLTVLFSGTEFGAFPKYVPVDSFRHRFSSGSLVAIEWVIEIDSLKIKELNSNSTVGAGSYFSQSLSPISE